MCVGGELEDLPVKDDVIDFRENRGCCRDLYCLFAFLICIIAMIIVFIVGFTQGNPKILYSPMDENGNFCGFDSGDKNFQDLPKVPYVLYYDKDHLKRGFCVEFCPTLNSYCVLNNHSISNESWEDCIENVGSFYYDKRDLDVVKDTIELMNRCIPNVEDIAKDLGKFDGLNNIFTGVVSDIKNAWWLFLIAGFLSILLCVLMLCCLRCCSKCCVWFIFVAGIVMLFILAIILIYYGGSNIRSILQTDGKSGRMFLIIGIIVLLACILIIIILIALRKRISLATTLVQEASNILKKNYWLLLVPLVYSLVFIIGCVLILVTMVYFFSSLEIDREGKDETRLNFNYQSRAIVAFSLFCFFWLNFFLVGMNQYTISGVGATYYFSRCAEERPRFPIARTLKVLFLHHLGSIAIGSFFIALVSWFRAIVIFLARKAKESKATHCKSFLSCLSCCLGAISFVVENLASRAYLMTALEGKNFLSSASDALKLVVSNPVRVGFLTAISKFLVIVAELFVTAVAVLICLLILRPDVLGGTIFMGVMYWWFIAVVCGVIAFFIAWIIFQVYEFLIDTVFFCFLYDEHMVKKYSLNYMPYASTDLKDFMKGVDKTITDPEIQELLPQTVTTDPKK